VYKKDEKSMRFNEAALQAGNSSKEQFQITLALGGENSASDSSPSSSSLSRFVPNVPPESSSGVLFLISRRVISIQKKIACQASQLVYNTRKFQWFREEREIYLCN
jgi:hypothetical protein